MRAAQSEALAHLLQERADREAEPALKRRLCERAACQLLQSDRYLRLAGRIDAAGFR